MSDDYHRPTYTTKDPHDAFNATQVRLYGIPGLPRPDKKKSTTPDYQPKSLPDVSSYIYKEETVIVVADMLPTNTQGDIIKKLIRTQKGIETADSSYLFVESIADDHMVMIGTLDLAAPVKDDGTPATLRTKKAKKAVRRLTVGIIFAYAYEGHTYELPKPKIMLIPAEPEPQVPRDDSGYDQKNYAGYTVWIVDKLDQCVEFEMSQGFVEQIVLEANLPGRRAPSVYASKMMMGHRSGRTGD